jgi:hypothetical protein
MTGAAVDPVRSAGRRMDEGNRFTPAAAVDAKIGKIRGDNGVSGMEFTKPNQAKICEVWASVSIARGQFCQAHDMFTDHKRRANQSFANECQNHRAAAEVEGGFGEHRVTSQQRLGHSVGNFEGPSVMLIVSITKGHQKTGVGDCIHFLEKPLRLERSLGPATAPASRRNERVSERLALSSSSRMMRPRGKPVLRAVCSNHSARSPGSRTVIVLLICIKCNTPVRTIAFESSFAATRGTSDRPHSLCGIHGNSCSSPCW